MKSLLIAIALAAGIAAGPAAAAVWDMYAQAPWQKGGREGRGGGPGYERGGGGGGNREARPERRDQGRERMSEEDRRSLHRDLDKANRELYGRHGR